MKKTGSFLLCLLLTFSFCLLFAACGGADAETTAATTATPQTTASPATTDAPATTVAPASTGAPATTNAPETTAAATTNAPQTTAAPATTEQPATTDDGLYTIVFSVDGKETAVEVPRGETPVVPDAIAQTWETEENYCKILGWDKEFVPADADTTYTATVGKYGLTLYEVRFSIKATDAVVSVWVHEGETPTPPDGYDAQYVSTSKIGTFKEWDKEIVAPTAENTTGGEPIVYTAVYTYAIREYTVTFIIGHNTYPVSAAYGSTPVCPVDPEELLRDSVAAAFLGWDKEIAKVRSDTVYTALLESHATLTAAKNGAKGVLTMTYDDGNYDTAVWVNQMNKKYGLRGSCMLIASRSGLTGNISGWKAIFADGTLDPQCHSWTHSKDTIEGTQALYQREVVQSKEALERYFPDNDILCYATPYCAVRTYSYEAKPGDPMTPKTDSNGNYIQIDDGGSNALIQKIYFANRNGPKGLQSLDPTPDDQRGGWYNVEVQWFYTNTSQTSAERLAWIDDAVENEGWLIILAHQIVDSADPNNGDDLYKLSKSNAEAFFKHASPYIKSGDLWAATFGEATKYIRERQNTTVSEWYDNDVVYVDMTINRTTADGLYMDESVFNYPLTVKVRVPSDWQSVYYQDGSMKTAKTFTEDDGFTYAMVNLTPGADGAVVTTAVHKLK